MTAACVAQEAHGVSAAQVLLRWALEKGVAVIPKASSEQRVAMNAELHGFALSAEELAALDAGAGMVHENVSDASFEWDAESVGGDAPVARAAPQREP